LYADLLLGEAPTGGRMTQELTARPADWPKATAYLDRALERTVAALEATAAISNLQRYYSTAGHFAGALFLEVGPSDPYSFTVGDLLALTLLDVAAPVAAVRRILQPGECRDRLNGRIAESTLPALSDLRGADATTFAAMEETYLDVKSAVSKAGSSATNAWVTASKLCARKRPDLFPVRDRVVCEYLGILKAGGYQIDWQVFRHLMKSTEVTDRLVRLVREAETADDVHVGQPDNLLRHLDVVLWMHARRGAVTSG
jgi:hypothetical protein